jgi:hypothetical protein
MTTDLWEGAFREHNKETGLIVVAGDVGSDAGLIDREYG